MRSVTLPRVFSCYALSLRFFVNSVTEMVEEKLVDGMDLDAMYYKKF